MDREKAAKKAEDKRAEITRLAEERGVSPDELWFELVATMIQETYTDYLDLSEELQKGPSKSELKKNIQALESACRDFSDAFSRIGKTGAILLGLDSNESAATLTGVAKIKVAAQGQAVQLKPNRGRKKDLALTYFLKRMEYIWVHYNGQPPTAYTDRFSGESTGAFLDWVYDNLVFLKAPLQSKAALLKYITRLRNNQKR